MTFKEWYYRLQEAGSFTNSIANFSQRLPFGSYPWPSIEDSYYRSPDEEKLKKKKGEK
jgi:hypothetical protein